MLLGRVCLCDHLIYLLCLQEIGHALLVGLALALNDPEAVEDLLEAVKEFELVRVWQLVEELQTRVEGQHGLLVGAQLEVEHPNLEVEEPVETQDGGLRVRLVEVLATFYKVRID